MSDDDATPADPPGRTGAPTRLRAEHHESLAVGARAPRLSWHLPAGAARQDASLSEAKARDAISGYTVVNDWSARDLQAREMQVGLGPAKGMDFATSIGPWLVTADELEPFHDADGFLDLDCTAYVNGALVGRDRLSHVHRTFPQMIA